MDDERFNRILSRNIDEALSRQKKLQEDYLRELDFARQNETADAERARKGLPISPKGSYKTVADVRAEWKNVPGIALGGGADKYYNKYIKYKTKYLRLKNNH
jgi:hypothetical protein